MAQPNKKKAVLDALEALSDEPSSSDSEGGSEAGEPAGATPAEQPAAKKQKISLEDLQAAGYQSGPSVLYMKPPEDEQQHNWAWSDGKAVKGKETEDSLEERRRTHEAATTAAEESARLALLAQQHANKLREEGRREREELAKAKKLTFNQKEKKKRDAGMASRGKSTVEEEKRIARNFGVYSGFD